MSDLQFMPEMIDRRALLGALRALKKGDFSVRMPLDMVGVDGEIADVFNDIVETNETIADEFARIREDVGKGGQINQRVRLPAAAGAWAAQVESVNALIGDLVRPTAEVARVIDSVAKGDLSQRMQLEIDGTPLGGEFLRIGKVVNTLVDQLNGFASEVTRVAREVGTDGKLGGQAQVKGVGGTWKGLTDNVNQLANNLTGQVRAIAEVATAVTKGDLTRSIMVEAMGEVAALKDNINEMIRNLKDTTLKNNEQDWLKTNLAKFSRMLQGHGDLVAVAKLVLSELAPLVNAQQGVIYTRAGQGADVRLELLSSYASRPSKHLPHTLKIGEGLLGQCAYEKKRIVLDNVSHDYIRIGSVLGSTTASNVIILPVLFEGEVKAVLELASIKKFNPAHLMFLEQLTESIGIVFNTIEANMRTGHLLQQSQMLTKELQSQQEELKQTNDRLEQQAQNLQNSERLLKKQQEELQSANDELQNKAQLLSEQMQQVEYKNKEVEQAKAALEDKAEQLALSSRYKSEFLANMSHELRTPLNSLLILAKLLADNVGDNLTPKQIDYAQTIYAAGADLLSLINDILDLAKIESGTVTLDIGTLRLAELRDYFERTFRQVAADKQLDFGIEIEPGLPAQLQTDEKRLQQILKNLLSNAFKFTERGRVDLRLFQAQSGWTRGGLVLEPADRVIAFSVTDTGIGIPENKQRVIFEAFQQADGTTSRQFGGTGLGLSISRELTRLLGGEIKVESTLGRGSTFILYLPLPGGAANAATPAAEIPAPPRRARAPTTPRPQARSEDGHRPAEPALASRKVLIVDDDVRNVFALTGALEQYGMQVLNAENGKEGIELLKNMPDIEVVLMDIMMPDLDGFDTIRIIRGDERFRELPIIAVTAKAMKGDREKCIDAGASDYIAKPVNVEQLVSLMRVWLNP